MSADQANGFWVLSRKRPCWIGGDYNGSWSSHTEHLRFPTEAAAKEHKKADGWEYFTPQFQRWST